MITKFWEAVGGRLADRWQVVGPGALVFWIGLGIAWYFGQSSPADLAEKSAALTAYAMPVQVLVLVSTFGIIATSAIIVRRCVPVVLAVLQGPWRGPLVGRWSRGRVMKKSQQVAAMQVRYAVLADLMLSGKADQHIVAELVTLDSRLRRIPADADYRRPTRVGNIFQSVSSVLVAKHGLDLAVVWPRLWLIFPESTRQDLIAARSALDMAVAAAIWGLLYCLALPFNVLTPAVGGGVLFCTLFFWIPNRAETFADLMESAVDMHRVELHQKLRLPLPEHLGNEVGVGTALCRYLQRGDVPEDAPGATEGGAPDKSHCGIMQWVKNVYTK